MTPFVCTLRCMVPRCRGMHSQVYGTQVQGYALSGVWYPGAGVCKRLCALSGVWYPGAGVCMHSQVYGTQVQGYARAPQRCCAAALPASRLVGSGSQVLLGVWLVLCRLEVVPHRAQPPSA